MKEHHIDIATQDGAMNSFIVHPEEGGPHPVVLFYMDAPGKREELHDMARRLASVGYYVVLPNLYYRRTRDWSLTERSDAQMAVMFEHMGSLRNAMVVDDTRAMLRHVDAAAAADGTRVGAVGYCMSGPFVMAAAAALPERLACIASIHGANLVTDRPDSPHLDCARIQCEAYFACAQTDRWAPPELVQTLQSALKQGGAPHRVEWYPDTEHGFVFPKRGNIYHRDGAERHWERLFDLFRRRLQHAP